MQGRVLALVGMAGSGKTVCAQHLEQRGFPQFRFGSLVVDEVTRRGQPINPENERIVREEFRERYGMDAMAQLALPRLRAMLAERPCIVIDGLYSFSEYKTLQRDLSEQLIVVAVVADRALRYARLAQRPERPLTAAQALERDYQEIERIEKGGPIAIADYTLLNNGGVPELLAALDALLERLAFHP
jgi:dephospho-CoA kinase